MRRKEGTCARRSHGRPDGHATCSSNQRASSKAPAAQANPSIGEMLTTIAAKVEALENKMASGGSATGFGSFDMAGKAVIITGGASGIGYGMCELFSQRGSKVFCLDLFPETVKKAEEALGPNVRNSPGQLHRPLAAP